MKSALNAINAHPKYVAWLGAWSGWASVDFLRYSQIAAALLAGAVSVCALILTAPKAWAQVKEWIYGSRP